MPDLQTLHHGKLQSVIDAVPNPHLKSTLKQVLHHLNMLTTKVNEYEAERDNPTYQSGRVFRSQIRNLDWKVKKQKYVINALTREKNLWRDMFHSNAELFQETRMRIKTMDSHLYQIKKAAEKGDLVRVLALAQEW